MLDICGKCPDKPVDKHIFYNGKSIFLVYTDDGIFLGSDLQELDWLREDLVTMGDLNKYLGIKVTKYDGGKIKLAQPHLIAQILEDLSFQPSMNSKEIPALSSVILKQDLDLPPMDGYFDFPSVIGKMTFLEKNQQGPSWPLPFINVPIFPPILVYPTQKPYDSLGDTYKALKIKG
jgi:hypothetical protein